jgi:hypothetical protein
MSKYIWYSGATDITGQALAEALADVRGTRTKPTLRSGDVLIGWGAKTDANIAISNGIHVLNHPDKIRANRNKVTALGKMKQNRDLGSCIATFCSASAVVAELGRRRSSLKLPLVGRTKYHQGGKGFWLCLTDQHVRKAIDDGAAYFQNYIDIKDEYRLHVAFGNVIYAVKKIENATESGWKNQRKEKIADYSRKNSWDLDDNTIDRVLAILYKEVSLPDRIVRSNRRGWKFSSVRLSNLSNPLKNAAKKAVEVMELDFGAVDCALGNDGLPYIIEINSGPGLQGTALSKYVDAFVAKIAEIEAPATRQAASTQERTGGLANRRVRRAVGADNANNQSRGMLRMMQNVSTDAEAQALIRVLMEEQSR